MKPESHQYTANVGDQTITFETGKLAAQAGGSVTVRQGDSIVFAAATMGGIREGIDFFPLTVEYEERMYAGGKIPGSFFRREGRPSEDAILTGRLTDRPLRPLFNQEMRNEVQVILFTLSADEIHPLDILAINAASAALMISDIPWAGPVGAVRIGKVNGAFVVNPTFTQIDQSELGSAHCRYPRCHFDGGSWCQGNIRSRNAQSIGIRPPIPPAAHRAAGKNGCRNRQDQTRRSRSKPRMMNPLPAGG